MLTLGSAVLAVVNIGVMWGMAHRWRYAWHGNLGLQLLWLPYDFVTKQYGLLALGAVMTVVSIKGCLHGSKAQQATAARSRSRHRRPRRGWFGRRVERTGAAGRVKTSAPSPPPARSRREAAGSSLARVPNGSTTEAIMLARRGDRRRQVHAGLAHRRKQAVHLDREASPWVPRLGRRLAARDSQGDRHRGRVARDSGSRNRLHHHTVQAPVAHGNVPARVGDEH
jgi:hypothetical protein